MPYNLTFKASNSLYHKLGRMRETLFQDYSISQRYEDNYVRYKYTVPEIISAMDSRLYDRFANMNEKTILQYPIRHSNFFAIFFRRVILLMKVGNIEENVDDPTKSGYHRFFSTV